jgi:hypothetical protein
MRSLCQRCGGRVLRLESTKDSILRTAGKIGTNDARCIKAGNGGHANPYGNLEQLHGNWKNSSSGITNQKTVSSGISRLLKNTPAGVPDARRGCAWRGRPSELLWKCGEPQGYRAIACILTLEQADFQQSVRLPLAGRV